MSEILIEVCCEDSDSNTDKGNLLEKFSKRFLETQGLNVTGQVRKNGMEIDLYCQETATGETIIVECKAYRSTIAAEVITKLLGSVSLHDYSSGWLISTYALGKDAKGIQEEWSSKPEEKRRRLRIYTPNILVDRLVRAKLIVPPSTLKVPDEHGIRAEEMYLLITKRGEFWAIPIIDRHTRIPATAMLFDASTGRPALDHELTSWLSQTDTSLNHLSWVSEKPRAPNTERLQEELQNIVSVPMADHWADYRPARPVDFIGRETMQKNVFEFFDNVRERKTSTRLIAVKAPSGWGKSSSVLKIVDKAHNIRNRSKYFVHSVDSRAALTKRFPELALVSAINAAIASDFIPKVNGLSFGSTGHFFSTHGMQAVLDALSKANKIICVFFDQFEELLYKEDLVDVFEEMRRLCTAIEEAQANVVIGFSWKTDGTITTEHSAYHLWHDLADRRLELDLPPFSEREVSLAIGRFGKELGQPVTQQLRRLLQDHCQGFPWLLKKLCVHILELSRSGADQSDVLTRNLNIITLFKKDIENLTNTEHSCIKQIAMESPAEFFKITQTYGDAVITSLVHKRLIIRSGTRLTIYWDIFRDYILTERIPYIPVTYTPQANFSVSIKALEYLKDYRQVRYEDLSKVMEMTEGSTDNLVRDLVNLGHVEASRKDGILQPHFDSLEAAFDIAFSFWRSHEIVRRVSAEIGYKTPFTENDFLRIFSAMHQRNEFSLNTLSVYSKRTLRWLGRVGLVGLEQGRLQLFNLTKRPDIGQDVIGSHSRARVGVFLPAAAPNLVVSAYMAIGAERPVRSEFEKLYGRNPVSALFNLGLARAQRDRMVSVLHSSDAEAAVREAALATTTIQLAITLLDRCPGLASKELGKLIGAELGMNWAAASHARYGSALRLWAEWISPSASLFDGGRT